MGKLNKQSNIVLIGMPGAGKSTLGVLLAKDLAKDYVDTDLLIQLKHHKNLQQIVDQQGYLQLRQMEEEVLLEHPFQNQVIATGGSAVYSEPGMARLKENSIIVFIDVPLNTLKQRIHNYSERGIAKMPGQTFEELYAERQVLYSQYQDITLKFVNESTEEALTQIYQALSRSI